MSNLLLHPLCRHLPHYIPFLKKKQPLFQNFFHLFCSFPLFPLFPFSAQKSFCRLLFSAVRFPRFSSAFYPLFRAYHSPVQYPRARAYHPAFKRSFHKLPAFPTICFCKICIISSFIPVPTDLISIHPPLHFSALKQFSPFHRSSDVSCVIHCFPAQSGYEKCPPPLERRTSFFYLLRLPRIRRTRHESVKLIAK